MDQRPTRCNDSSQQLTRGFSVHTISDMKALTSILIVIVLTSLVACDSDNQFVNPFAPAPQGPVSLTVTPEKSADNAIISGDDAQMVVEFHSPSGIGRAKIVAEDGNWPDALILRFHLKDLEGIELNTSEYHFKGFLGGTERVIYYGRDANGTPDPSDMPGQVPLPIERNGDTIDVVIPMELLTDDTLQLQWIDYYR
jgi:hypothetical protein